VRLSFGDCVLDTDTRELRLKGARADLTPKAYELLELLLRERPKAVSKALIRDRLWPKTFVSDVTLTTLAFEVRKAIGDDAKEPRHLRTVRGYGYAFAGELVESDAAASPEVMCRLLMADREFRLSAGEHVIGRGAEAQLVLDLPKVSRLHARIRVTPAGNTIEDLGSKNGTLVGGRRIEAPAPLRDMDEVQIGSVRLIFRDGSRAAPTETDG